MSHPKGAGTFEVAPFPAEDAAEAEVKLRTAFGGMSGNMEHTIHEIVEVDAKKDSFDVPIEEIRVDVGLETSYIEARKYSGPWLTIHVKRGKTAPTASIRSARRCGTGRRTKTAARIRRTSRRSRSTPSCWRRPGGRRWRRRRPRWSSCGTCWIGPSAKRTSAIRRRRCDPFPPHVVVLTSWPRRVAAETKENAVELNTSLPADAMTSLYQTVRIATEMNMPTILESIRLSPDLSDEEVTNRAQKAVNAMLAGSFRTQIDSMVRHGVIDGLVDGLLPEQTARAKSIMETLRSRWEEKDGE